MKIYEYGQKHEKMPKCLAFIRFSKLRRKSKNLRREKFHLLLFFFAHLDFPYLPIVIQKTKYLPNCLSYNQTFGFVIQVKLVALNKK